MSGARGSCISVDGFVVAAFSKGRAAVGVGVDTHMFVNQAAVFTDTLCSGNINLQFSTTIIALLFHFLNSKVYLLQQYLNSPNPVAAASSVIRRLQGANLCQN